MKKRILTLSLAVLTLAGVTTFTSCKKGENDSISLRTRKARLSGDWTLESASGNSSYTSGGTTSSDTYTVSNGNITYTSGGSSTTYPLSIELTINKDNSFERVINEDGDIFTQRGSWAFVNKNKELELKNKEAIILTISSSADQNGTDTYTGTEPDELLVLDRLTNKEMVVKSESSYTSSGFSSTNTSEMTYVK